MMDTPTVKESIQVYRQEAGAELSRILTFWERHAVDGGHGGFVGQLSNRGEVNPVAPKGAVLNARILWTFSAACRHTQNEAHRKLADRAYHYLVEHFLDKDYGGVFWSVNYAGEPLNTRKQIYAVAFAVYGLSEYYLATQEAQALQVCQDLFRWIEQHSFDPMFGGYLEAFDRQGQPLGDLRLSEKDRNTPKTMNTHLHVLEAYANLYRIWPDQQLATQLEGLIRVFLHHIIDTETGHLKLFLTRDWMPAADLVSYGHDIEASWLLLEAADVLGNEVLVAKVKTVALKMAQATTEGLQSDGSLYHELDLGEHQYDKHREWWVSAEAMVGFLNAFQLTHSRGFLEKSTGAWGFAKKYLLDRENGEWFWGVHDDYSLMAAADKIGFWKCPYHNARACLEVMHRCEKLLHCK
ncbi:AGE family epimerase/isomerase [Pontibacter mangrovi]|uniref:Cellobiose 2-epimerase n=1 Tax=Pontibacter mangrovi TaxID=2589816 RepID=A0A501W9H4_9BACT|nr:AGE family epimerase/isomerase [Pontibacter mangrovi]TPE43457.1 N-acyl-D-glucosamine 2-epimerase [Pontibacter mangrovi]